MLQKYHAKRYKSRRFLASIIIKKPPTNAGGQKIKYNIKKTVMF
jgi:hypothetical protein